MSAESNPWLVDPEADANEYDSFAYDQEDPLVIEALRKEEADEVLAKLGFTPDRPYYTFHDVNRLAGLLVERVHEVEDTTITNMLSAIGKHSVKKTTGGTEALNG